RLSFSDGSVWTSQQLSALALSTSNQGTDADDHMEGTRYHSERLIGGLGNDTLVAVGDGDVLDAGTGHDILKTQDGAEKGTTFIGGAGDDSLTGNYYNDTYVFNRGDGADTIADNGPLSTSTSDSYQDRLMFGEGIAREDLW